MCGYGYFVGISANIVILMDGWVDRVARTVLGGERLALHPQHQRVAGARAFRELLRHDAYSPIFAALRMAGQVLFKGGVAGADDLTEQALCLADQVGFCGVLDVRGGQVPFIIDVQDENLKKLLALERVILKGQICKTIHSVN